MACLMADQQKARRNQKPIDPNDEIPIAGKVVVVTGANSGLWAVAALEFARRGARVVMPCRDVEKAEKVVQGIKDKVPGSDLTLLSLDLADLDSVRRCAAEIRTKFDQIQILVNNAGVFFIDDKIGLTKHGFEQHMGINHLGPFLFTNLLLDLVVKAAPSARIVFTASDLYMQAQLDLDDWMLEKRRVFGGQNMGPYGNSKLANMYNAYSLAKKLEGTGVHTYALHPGIVKTELRRNFTRVLMKIAAPIMNKMVAIEPEEGADNILYCALSNKCAAESGLMHRCNGLWEEKAVDEQLAERLWEMSEKAVAQN